MELTLDLTGSGSESGSSCGARERYSLTSCLISAFISSQSSFPCMDSGAACGSDSGAIDMSYGAIQQCSLANATAARRTTRLEFKKIAPDEVEGNAFVGILHHVMFLGGGEGVLPICG